MSCCDSFACRKKHRQTTRVCIATKNNPCPITSWIVWSTSLTVLPSSPFAMPVATLFSNVPPFDITTSNPMPANFAQTLLAPYNGYLSDLTFRIQCRVPSDNNPVNGASFSVTLYTSPSSLSVTPQTTTGWSGTALTVNTPVMNIASNASQTATVRTANSVPVLAGSLVTAVITPSGYDFFAIQPATIDITFSYSRNRV